MGRRANQQARTGGAQIMAEQFVPGNFIREAKIELRLVNGETPWVYLDGLDAAGVHCDTVTHHLEKGKSPWGTPYTDADYWDTVPRFCPMPAILWLEY